MDAQRVIQRIVTVLIITIGMLGNSVFAGLVRIYGGDFNQPIPKPDINDPYISKGWMEDAVIEVTQSFIITDLDVRIDVTHTNVFDLQIFLQGPDDTRVCLNMYSAFDKFFIGADYTQTVFDDEAAIPIGQGQPPFDGQFRPLDKLSIFDGADACGTWRLQINDMWDWDTGTLNIFELIFAIPEPATLVFLVVGAGLITPFRH